LFSPLDIAGETATGSLETQVSEALVDAADHAAFLAAYLARQQARHTLAPSGRT
jgi:hypothetical protein